MADKASAPTQRQLRVGEELRHALASIFLQEDFHEPGISGISITVSEVRVSADLRNATVFVLPLGGKAPVDFLKTLEVITPKVRYYLSKKVSMRFLPLLYFKMDKSYEYAEKISTLLSD